MSIVEASTNTEAAIQRITEATVGTSYEGSIFLVGGYVRDKLLGRESEQDLDLVVLGDSIALSQMLYEKEVSSISPVTFPRFGVARLKVNGISVEIVTARAESYSSNSRQPVTKPASLYEDVQRRDFTLNTLLLPLHGKQDVIDLLGTGLVDLKAGILRTPLAPEATFYDDPLRMLRSVRFSAQLGFRIDDKTRDAIASSAGRLRIISQERIRDELVKVLLTPNPVPALGDLRDLGLLKWFLPELIDLCDMGQGVLHHLDAWYHTMKVLGYVCDNRASLQLRLAALFHDIGKPATKTTDEDGEVHFYAHEKVGARMTDEILRRLKFSNEEADSVSQLVGLHMRLNLYTPGWGKPAIRRLIREVGDNMEDLILLHQADRSGHNPLMSLPTLDADAFRARILSLTVAEDPVTIDSPLTGNQIMEILGIGPGLRIGQAKDYLINSILDGDLEAGDEDRALEMLLDWQCS